MNAYQCWLAFHVFPSRLVDKCAEMVKKRDAERRLEDTDASSASEEEEEEKEKKEDDLK